MTNPTARRFEDLIAWQRAHQLQSAIIEMTTRISHAEPALADQLRRAARSVTANVAEGFERNTRGDFARFLAIAKGSAGEIRSHLYECHDARLIPTPEFDELKTQAEIVSATIAKLRSAIQDQRRS